MENVLEQKKAAKRKRLLDAAYTLFQEKGAANTTINDIAKEAQVAKGTFYLYFRDKTEILDALVMQILPQGLSQRLHPPGSGGFRLPGGSGGQPGGLHFRIP